jgi:hypothetical protein
MSNLINPFRTSSIRLYKWRFLIQVGKNIHKYFLSRGIFPGVSPDSNKIEVLVVLDGALIVAYDAPVFTLEAG